jgi:hypothetical protein
MLWFSASGIGNACLVGHNHLRILGVLSQVANAIQSLVSPLVHVLRFLSICQSAVLLFEGCLFAGGVLSLLGCGAYRVGVNGWRGWLFMVGLHF